MTRAICESTHPSTFVVVCTGKAACRLVVQGFNGDTTIIAAYGGPNAKRNAILAAKKLNLAFVQEESLLPAYRAPGLISKPYQVAQRRAG